MNNIRCHLCHRTMEGTTATLDGKWICPRCLYERETGKEAKPAPRPVRGQAQR